MSTLVTSTPAPGCVLGTEQMLTHIEDPACQGSCSGCREAVDSCEERERRTVQWVTNPVGASRWTVMSHRVAFPPPGARITGNHEAGVVGSEQNSSLFKRR